MQLVEEFQSRSVLIKEAWETMAEVTVDLFCILNADGFFAYANEASAGMTGYEPWELEGRHFTELLHQDDCLETEQALRGVFNGFKRKDIQNRLVHKDGSDVQMLWSAVWSEEEGVMFCVGRDISGLVVRDFRQEEKEIGNTTSAKGKVTYSASAPSSLKEVSLVCDETLPSSPELELSQLAKDLHRKNSDLQQFTYIVSHNLRNPIANAIGLANLLTTTDRSSSTFDKTLSYLRLSLYRMDSVLLDMNTILSVRDRRGNVGRERVEIKEIVLQAMSALEGQLKEAGVTINVDITYGLELQANKAYLYSIIFNLLSNSIKYRAEGRRLEVDINSCREIGGGVGMSFSDNGSGFDSQKNKENVFKLYKRFHPNTEGRGMGLFLIKSHLDSMGGTIEVNSQVGEGTNFRIHLPK